MDYLTWLGFSHYVPVKYWPIIMAVLGVWVAIEQVLPATSWIKANSTAQAINNTVAYFMAKIKGEKKS